MTDVPLDLREAILAGVERMEDARALVEAMRSGHFYAAVRELVEVDTPTAVRQLVEMLTAMAVIAIDASGGIPPRLHIVDGPVVATPGPAVVRRPRRPRAR